ncbi:uncharacterized protein [Primulina huaijiensis]|uniref:uncharacterized protein n=1 Tax=Primulina huaijiensis TaxID=1492673 RepID=UPI003CC6DDEE
MSSTSKAWLVAATIGAVEALKDQGFCRWNYGIKLLQQHTKNRLRSYSHPHPEKLSNIMTQARMKKSEESFRKVMYLSCWGPN